MATLAVCIGTMEPTDMVLDLDEYGTKAPRPAIGEEEETRALELLDSTMNQGSMFANAGHRNVAAVNASIALHVLGYDPTEWFTNLLEDPYVGSKFYDISRVLFMEHVERVADYLDRWGPKDCEYWAFDFAL